MAYTTIAASQTDADSPIDQTLMDALRLNEDDLNSRLGLQEALSNNAIRDDFTGTAVDTNVWATGAGGGTGVLLQDGAPDHWLRAGVSAAGDYGIAAADTKHMRFNLGRDHTVIYEGRVKGGTTFSQTNNRVKLGFADESLAFNDTNNASVADVAAFVMGTNSKSLKFITARASSSDVSDNLGDYTAWMTLKIVITYAGATKQIQAFTGTTQANYVEVPGSPFTTTTKHPNILMKPWLGFSGQAGLTAGSFYSDYAFFYWNARPLST